MKQASDYPVTYPYGATSPPYSKAYPHKGNDRPTPMKTPIIIGGVKVARTGNSGSYKGMSYAPHLHTQAGRDFYVQNPINPTKHEFKAGTVVQTGTASQWGKYLIIRTGDIYVVYAHLYKIYAKVGQVIKNKEVDLSDQKYDDYSEFKKDALKVYQTEKNLPSGFYDSWRKKYRKFGKLQYWLAAASTLFKRNKSLRKALEDTNKKVARLQKEARTDDITIDELREEVDALATEVETLTKKQTETKENIINGWLEAIKAWLLNN